MRKIIFKSSLLVCAGLFALSANAQQKPAGTKKFGKPFTTASNYCGAVENEELLKEKNSDRATKQQFEEWIAPKIAEIKKQNLQKDGQGTNAVVTIPIVFHVIHNGDAIGENENISENQILSQITTLNQDYRKAAGTPGYNNHLVGADMEIEFCIARRTPNGLPSSGIVRYNIGDDNGWTREEVELVKAQTQWDPNKYLNFWVFDEILTTGGYLAGYAQFPTDSTLFGLPEDSEANTDGVALGARFVGSIDLDPEGLHDDTRNMGRTATHEIGHFFGLRHIWGDDGNCYATDYCADTPPALEANYGCQIGLDSCPEFEGPDMIENYMDYTDDACLNIFTMNQKERMQAVLANSPRRKTLPASDGCIVGTASLNNDGAIYLQPFDTKCNNAIAPVISFSNTGTNTITSAIINYKIDNAVFTPYMWDGSLAPGEDVRIELPETGVVAGEHTFTAKIINVNGGADALASNNTRTNEFSFEEQDSYDTETITITVQTDEYASEITWLLMDTNDNMVAYGTGYEDNPDGVLDIQTVTVDSNTCYTFYILDDSADDMGMNWGYYTIETQTGELIKEQYGVDIYYFDYAQFGINVDLLGTKTPEKAANGIVLYPNPANSILNIASTNAEMPESYIVYNSLGQVMEKGNVTSVLQSFDISKYANGVYFVKLAKGESATTLQFIKH